MGRRRTRRGAHSLTTFVELDLLDLVLPQLTSSPLVPELGPSDDRGRFELPRFLNAVFRRSSVLGREAAMMKGEIREEE
jgi:hypothetical protein